MQDVFEPMNFAGEVFEPTANFSGEAFEPMNFDGEYSNFAVLNCGCKVKHPFNKGKRDECIKNCNQKKDAKKGISPVDSTSTTPTPLVTPKKTTTTPSSNVKPSTDSLQSGADDSGASDEKFLGMPKKVGIGVTIGVGVLIIGLTTFLLLRKK